MRGVCSAAAAQKNSPFTSILKLGRGKFSSFNKENSLSVHHLWKPRIRLNQNRKMGIAQKLTRKFLTFFKRTATVKANNIRPKGFKIGYAGKHIRSGKSAKVFLKSHRGNNGQLCVFPYGKNRSLNLKQVAHGFYYGKVCTGLFCRHASRLVGFVCLVKSKASHRLQKLSNLARVPGAKMGAFNSFCLSLCNCRLLNFYSLCNVFFRSVGRLFKLNGVCTK